MYNINPYPNGFVLQEVDPEPEPEPANTSDKDKKAKLPLIVRIL